MFQTSAAQVTKRTMTALNLSKLCRFVNNFNF